VKEKDNLEDLGLDGRILFKWILNKYDGKAVNCNHVLCMGKWWSSLNTVTNLLFPLNEETFLIS
jgi:hypothetical protein